MDSLLPPSLLFSFPSMVTRPFMPPRRMERKIFEAFSRILTDGKNRWLDVEEEEDVDEDEALDEVWTAEDDEER